MGQQYNFRRCPTRRVTVRDEISENKKGFVQISHLDCTALIFLRSKLLEWQKYRFDLPSKTGFFVPKMRPKALTIVAKISENVKKSFNTKVTNVKQEFLT